MRTSNKTIKYSYSKNLLLINILKNSHFYKTSNLFKVLVDNLSEDFITDANVSNLRITNIILTMDSNQESIVDLESQIKNIALKLKLPFSDVATNPFILLSINEYLKADKLKSLDDYLVDYYANNHLKKEIKASRNIGMLIHHYQQIFDCSYFDALKGNDSESKKLLQTFSNTTFIPSECYTPKNSIKTNNSYYHQICNTVYSTPLYSDDDIKKYDNDNDDYSLNNSIPEFSSLDSSNNTNSDIPLDLLDEFNTSNLPIIFDEEDDENEFSLLSSDIINLPEIRSIAITLSKYKFSYGAIRELILLINNSPKRDNELKKINNLFYDIFLLKKSDIKSKISESFNFRSLNVVEYQSIVLMLVIMCSYGYIKLINKDNPNITLYIPKGYRVEAIMKFAMHFHSYEKYLTFNSISYKNFMRAIYMTIYLINDKKLALAIYQNNAFIVCA